MPSISFLFTMFSSSTVRNTARMSQRMARSISTRSSTHSVAPKVLALSALTVVAVAATMEDYNFSKYNLSKITNLISNPIACCLQDGELRDDKG
jgi:hypothetical protein